jgi:hypothetical protein
VPSDRVGRSSKRVLCKVYRSQGEGKGPKTYLSRVDDGPLHRLRPEVKTLVQRARAPVSHGMRIDRLSSVDTSEKIP